MTDVRLAPLSSADAEKMNEWQNDAEIRDLLMGFRGPVSIETTQDWIKGLRDQNLKSRVVFGIRHDGELVGMINLFSIDWIHRVAKLGVFLGSPKIRGKGIGRRACQQILDYAFNDMGLERVMLEVLAENPARHLYERLGFKQEGVMVSAYLHHGRRVDVAVYGLLADYSRP